MKPKVLERTAFGNYLYEARVQFPPVQGKHKMSKHISQGDFVAMINRQKEFKASPIAFNTYVCWESKGSMPSRENERRVTIVVDRLVAALHC